MSITITISYSSNKRSGVDVRCLVFVIILIELMFLDHGVDLAPFIFVDDSGSIVLTEEVFG